MKRVLIGEWSLRPTAIPRVSCLADPSQEMQDAFQQLDHDIRQYLSNGSHSWALLRFAWFGFPDIAIPVIALAGVSKQDIHCGDSPSAFTIMQYHAELQMGAEARPPPPPPLPMPGVLQVRGQPKNPDEKRALELLDGGKAGGRDAVRRRDVSGWREEVV